MAAERSAPALLRLAAIVGLIAPLLVAAGLLGMRFGLIDWRLGYQQMSVEWAFWAAAAGVALGLVAAIVSLRALGRHWLLLVPALIAPGLVLGLGWKTRAAQAANPPIADVATDWAQPLGFSTNLDAQRRGAEQEVLADPVAPASVGAPWAGRRIAEINAETCPGARPVLRNVTADEVAAAMESAGVQVQGRAVWRVEGSVQSFWYGFEDDIVARIHPQRTDIRSIGREPRADGGANCARVTAIVKALEGQASR